MWPAFSTKIDCSYCYSTCYFNAGLEGETQKRVFWKIGKLEVATLECGAGIKGGSGIGRNYIGMGQRVLY